jgi:hypothetical protein
LNALDLQKKLLEQAIDKLGEKNGKKLFAVPIFKKNNLISIISYPFLLILDELIFII